MKKLLAQLRLAAPAIATDLIGLAGAGCIVAGVAIMHVATALIVAGMMLVASAWQTARRS